MRAVRAVLVALLAAAVLSPLPAQAQQLSASAQCDRRAMVGNRINAATNVTAITLDDKLLVVTWANSTPKIPCRGIYITGWGQTTTGDDGWWQAGSTFHITAGEIAREGGALPTNYTSPPFTCYYFTHEEARVLVSYNQSALLLPDSTYGKSWQSYPAGALAQQTVKPHRVFTQGDGTYLDYSTNSIFSWDGSPDALPAALAAATAIG
jgi:hypothetical protein